MNRQALWDKEAGELRKKRAATLKRNIKSGRAGFSALDWAFFVGSRANRINAGFDILMPNKQGNSWVSLTKLGIGALATDTASPNLKRWEATPESASKLMRKLARRFGADEVGFCLLDRRWVYSHWFDEETKKDHPIKFSDEPGYEVHNRPVQLEDGTMVIPKEMKYVIVLVHEMAEDAVAGAPTLTLGAESGLEYSKIAMTTVSLAESIRALGYNAIPSANCTAINIPLAIDAGLGQLGRNAKLITPHFGPRCRISKVITDMPLATAEPVDLGVTEFCDRCQKCATKCPGKAIPSGGRSFEPANDGSQRGIFRWQVDHKKCEEGLAEVGTICGVCIRVCPFNKRRGRMHDIARWSVKNLKFANPLLIRLDDALGYGKYKSPNDHLWRDITGGKAASK